MVAMLASVFSQPWPQQKVSKEINSQRGEDVVDNRISTHKNARLRFNSENLDEFRFPLHSLRTSSEGDNGNDCPKVLQKEVIRLLLDQVKEFLKLYLMPCLFTDPKMILVLKISTNCNFLTSLPLQVLT